MVRLPATDSAQRIGSLFLNPGGPGGSGVDFVLGAGPFLYADEVRERFDIVGFDPRGIGRSTALRCFGNARQWDPGVLPFPYPTTLEEEELWEAADLFLIGECDQCARRIIDHMTTADVARDLDLLRQAVGDEKLTYAGFSYGSYLGVTYANLFPDKVRALVVDGVLDPIEWATGSPGQGSTVPFSTRIRSDAGALATLNEFFRLCDEGNSAFSGDSANRYAALIDRLRAEPIVVTLPDGTSFFLTHSYLISYSLGALYSSFSWPAFAEMLAAIENMATPAEIGARLQVLSQDLGFITKRGFPQYQNLMEGMPGVACSDCDNPDSFAAWSEAAAASEAEYGYFGPIWTWLSSVCTAWPGSMAGRYTGPFDSTTSNPVLVVSTLYDPATRYEGALTVADLLPNSRLLTVNGWGHCTPFLSQCADGLVSDYLVDGVLPPDGTVCNQDWVPFTGPPVATGVPGAATKRSRVTPAMVPDVVRKVFSVAATITHSNTSGLSFPDTAQELPARDFGLFQNFPNEFNPDTWIPYQLAADVDVNIRIYDVSGNLIRTLALGHKPAGFYTDKSKAAYWDGKNEAEEQVSSGIYFYTIQAGEFAATKKMVIAK
jgi:pimeloyl-ACP methyl ester carboxylesterase